MDNLCVKVLSQGSEALAMALKLAWSHKIATHYRIEKFSGSPIKPDEKGIDTLIFYWHESTQAKLLPFPMDYEAAVRFAVDWLKTADYGKEPDHDGDNGKGWFVFNESWGHVAGEWQAFVAIQPAWAEYGK